MFGGLFVARVDDSGGGSDTLFGTKKRDLLRRFGKTARMRHTYERLDQMKAVHRALPGKDYTGCTKPSIIMVGMPCEQDSIRPRTP